MSDKDRFGNKDSKGSQDHNTTSSRKESSKKSKNSVFVEGSGGGGENGKNERILQGLSPETQRLVESIRNQSNSSSSSKKNVPHSMVEDILREAKLKAASRAIDTNNHVKKSSREESL